MCKSLVQVLKNKVTRHHCVGSGKLAMRAFQFMIPVMHSQKGRDWGILPLRDNQSRPKTKHKGNAEEEHSNERYCRICASRFHKRTLR